MQNAALRSERNIVDYTSENETNSEGGEQQNPENISSAWVRE